MVVNAREKYRRLVESVYWDNDYEAAYNMGLIGAGLAILERIGALLGVGKVAYGECYVSPIVADLEALLTSLGIEDEARDAMRRLEDEERAVQARLENEAKLTQDELLHGVSFTDVTGERVDPKTIDGSGSSSDDASP